MDQRSLFHHCMHLVTYYSTGHFSRYCRRRGTKLHRGRVSGRTATAGSGVTRTEVFSQIAAILNRWPVRFPVEVILRQLLPAGVEGPSAGRF
jgi:regulator of sigma D